MHIIVVGLNHRTAPVEIREKVAFDEAQLPQDLVNLRRQKSIFESVIISTCNRSEIYIVADQLHTGRYYTKRFLAERFGVDKDVLSPYLFIKENDAAIEHLFRVASGLDSMVLGETQILGQVRNSLFTAQDAGVTGTIFNRLFKDAVTVAKRAHAETMINDNAVSVSYAAVELAGKIFGDFSDKRMLLIGAGKMSELTAKHLVSHGAKDITVMNRTIENAEELAEQFSARALSLNELESALPEADIVVTSTGARDYVLTADIVKPAVAKRKGRPLFVVDIAVPRDVEGAVDELESVILYDIDDLNGVVESNLEQRKEEAEKIDLLVEEQLVAFMSWMQTLDAIPVISALRQKATSIQEETMKSIDRKLPDLTKRERKVLNKHTKSIINQMLRDPVQKAKEMSGERDNTKQLSLFVDIFGIEEELELEKRRLEAKQTTLQNQPKNAPAFNSAAGDWQHS